jgi:hypothetical protein
MVMRNLALLRPANIMGAPDYVNHVILTTSPQAFDVPSGAAQVAFASNGDFAIKYGSTAVTWPTTNVVDGTGNEINPTARDIGSTARTSGFSIVAPSAGGIVTLAWFKPGG